MPRLVLATLVSLLLLAAFSLAQEKPPLRVESGAPEGEGGELIISVEPQLCAQSGLLVRLMRQDAEGRPTFFNVFETALGKPCSWTVTDLWPGNYHLMVQRGYSGHSPEIFVHRAVSITPGARFTEPLSTNRTEISGLVTVDGARLDALEGMVVSFRRPNESFAHAEIPVGAGGEYRGHLNFAGDVQVMLEKVIFSKFMNAKVESNPARYDIDLPPGIIKLHVVPPPGLTTDYRIHCDVSHEAPTTQERRRPDVSRTSVLVLMDKPQTYFIAGKGYGRYTITAGTATGNPAESRPLIPTVVVHLTVEEPYQQAVLDLSEVQLAPTLMRPVNIENCPPPRTSACVHGQQ